MRPWFYAKCIAVGALLRLIIFGLVLVKQRIFSTLPLFFELQQENSFYSLETLSSYIRPDFGERTSVIRSNQLHEDAQNLCSMSNCFNFSRCHGNMFKVHIYPTTVLETLLTSINESTSISAYTKILSSIIRSGYYTSNPDEACLFVVAYDTLDRDLLSADYVKNLNSKFASLPASLWNNGENHLIFNLYPGTWPDYDLTDLGIVTGKAILVKASFSIRDFRQSFDISLPLFHRVLPLSTVEEDDGLFRPVVSSADYGSDSKRRRYMFSFKGKRYVHGIGSETRNSLYHLHDGGRESVVVTTCKHGKNWRQVKDERCDEDNELYDHWGSYEWLLSHTDFCLVPRGRRLGSYRFLEALQYGCVPTVLANEWELPFSEIMPWTDAVVMADERLVSVIPDALHEIKPGAAFVMRMNAKRLSQMYFSSFDRIVSTTLEIVKRRLKPWTPSPLDKRNLQSPSINPSTISPRFHAYLAVATKRNPTAIKRLVDAVAISKFCWKITVLCFDCSMPKANWPVPIEVVRLGDNDAWSQLMNLDDDAGKADAVFWIDTSSIIQLSTDEIDFAMEVWRWFPDRLVGYFSRHIQRDAGLSSKLLNEFSFLSSAALLFHKSYNDELNSQLHLLSPEIRLACFDRLLNRLFMEKGKTPIKLTLRYIRVKTSTDWVSTESCFGNEWNFTDLVLRTSKVRFDPLLYKDPVSNLRKKYRQMELNGVS